MKRKKIKWKKLLAKAIEDAIKKAIELAIIALLLGLTIKVIMITVPAVSLGSVIAKLAKIHLFD